MLLLVLIQVIPSAIGQIDFRRFQSGIQIHITPFSLAYAALEDEFLDVDEEREWIPKNHPSTFLRAGEVQPGAPTLLARIGSPTESGSIAKAQTVKVQLQGMKMNLAKILAENGQSFSLKAEGQRLEPVGTRTEAEQLASRASRFKDAGSRVVGSAPYMHRSGDQPHTSFSVSVPSQHAVNSTMATQAEAAQPNRGPARGNGGIVVFGVQGSAQTPGRREGFATRSSKSQQRYVRKQDGSPQRRAKRATSNDVETFARYSNTGDSTAAQGDRHNLFIEGQIELAEGMAFLGSGDQLIVYRESFGEIEQGGHVSIHDGDYSIWVSDLSGRLVAELVSSSGHIYGRGEVDLDALSVAKNQTKIQNVQLMIREAASGLIGRVQTFHSYEKKIFALAESKIGVEGFDIHHQSEISGQFQEQLVLPGTQFISRVEKEGFWPTLTYMSEGQKKNILMLSEADIGAIAGLVYDLKLGIPDLKGVILGRVTDRGRSVSGARVYLNGSMLARPVYFNDINGMLVPDPSLEATTSNGLFVFLQQPTSLTSIEAERNGRVSELLLLPVEEGHVSQVQLELTQSERLRLRVTEAFGDQKPLEAVANFLGNSKTYKLPANEDFVLSFAPGDQPLWLDIGQSHSDFIPVTLSQTRKEDRLNIPLVGKEWLKSFYEQTGEELIADRGFIIGFVDHMDGYEVLLDHVAVENAQRVYYFDENGEWLLGNQGVASGGFIVLNAEEGLYSLIIQAEGSAHYLGKSVYVEPGRAGLVLDSDLY